MIDISKFLQNIKNAVYGVDVRESIHDAIKECGDLVNQCYKDATGHPESVSALVREIDVERSRIDELLNASDTDAEYSEHIIQFESGPGTQGSPIPAYIYSNGINAVLAVAIQMVWSNNTLYEAYQLPYKLPEELLPINRVSRLIGSPNLYLAITETGNIQVEGNGSYDPEPFASEPKVDDPTGSFRVLYLQYPLKNPSIGEVNDLRIAADGTIYPTAGEAVRAQVVKLKDKNSSSRTMIELLRTLLDKAAFTEDVTPLLALFDETFYDGMFKVSYNLNNIKSSEITKAVEEGNRFSTELTADIGYNIASVTVTMGGEDITDIAYNDGVVTINSVTGDIVITAVSMDAGMVLLKSITGDGNSYIDTEFIPDSLDYRYEFAIKADDYDSDTHNATNTDTLYTIFGVDMYNVGSAYHRIYAYLQSKTKVTFDCLGQPSTGGSWNLPTFFADNIGYCVCKNGFAQVYTDSEHSVLPNWNGTTSGIAKDESKCPIKPMYIFTINATENSFMTESDKTYPVTKFTLYDFKIYRDSTNELLHNFIPAANDGKVGVYDAITGKFHENKGTGSFSYEEVSA